MLVSYSELQSYDNPESSPPPVRSTTCYQSANYGSIPVHDELRMYIYMYIHTYINSLSLSLSRCKESLAMPPRAVIRPAS